MSLKNKLVFKTTSLATVLTLSVSLIAPGISAHAAESQTNIDHLKPVTSSFNNSSQIETDVHTIALDSNGNVIEINGNNHLFTSLAKSSRKVIGSYTLSKSQTKKVAASMKATKNHRLEVIIGVLGSATGPYGVISAAATLLAIDSSFSSTVVKAAKKNKRIKITITDATPHTSYSTQVKYSIVK